MERASQEKLDRIGDGAILLISKTQNLNGTSMNPFATINLSRNWLAPAIVGVLALSSPSLAAATRDSINRDLVQRTRLAQRSGMSPEEALREADA